ncbi:MAG TPA: GNAT family protein [Propionibacteriaceae bacterium]
MTLTRLVRLEDAAALAQLQQDNRDFLARWDPVRAPGFFTDDGQRSLIEVALHLYEQGVAVPHVIVCGERIVGRINLNSVVRGAFQSCSMGYWLSETDNGRGLATSAVREMVELAFDELRLHRVEAGTLLDNVASQRVLERNGFVRFGVAPKYLNIAGQWQDHALYQRLAA